jgi:uncharacterized protein (DUF111 family)
MINVDNVSGEVIPYLIETSIERGASNVHVVNAITKKGRPEYLFFVDVEEEKLESVVGFLLAELGSLGYRLISNSHMKSDYEVERSKVNLSKLGIPLDREVRIKVIRRADGSILTANIEYEDLRALTELLEDDEVRIPMMKLKSMIEGHYLNDNLVRQNDSKP